MSRTLIGQLILRLRSEGLGEARKVVTAMDDIERRAKTLGATGVKSWGTGFDKQLRQLKLTNDEIGRVQQSWVALHNDMAQRKLGGAMKSAEVSHWKTQTIGALAEQRAAWDQHYKKLEDAHKRHRNRVRDYMKPALVMMGAYSLPYFGGMLGSEALTASSERRREIFRQKMAGISESDQGRLFDASESVAQKYPSVPITGVMELSRAAYSTMGSAERSAEVLERAVQGLVVMQSTRGPDAALHLLTSLIRGLDNLGLNKDGPIGVKAVNDMINAAVRASQADPDFDSGSFFSFAKATKVAGPALSYDFLSRAPVYMQDMGEETTGKSLAMAFKAFVLEAVGSAGGKKYLEERDRIGIRKNGQLVDSELFGSDPDKWVLEHLVPALERDGVDLNNNTQVAAAIGKLSGNTNATGFLTRIVTQREQVERWLQMMNQALGTEVAEQVRFEDPFVGWTGFKKALENLSAAMTPIDSINSGLNGLADGINRLAAAAKDNPGLTALGLGAGAVGTYKGGKFVVDKLSDAFGLKSSAIALDGSAAALTRAALALQGAAGADAAGDVGGGKKPGGKGGGVGLWWLSPHLAGAAAAASVLKPKPTNEGEDAALERQRAEYGLFANDAEMWAATTPAEERKRLLDAVGGDENSPGAPQIGPTPKPVPAPEPLVSPVEIAPAPAPAAAPAPSVIVEPAPAAPAQVVQPPAPAPSAETQRVDQAFSLFTEPAKPDIDTTELQAKAKAAGDEIQRTLSVTAKPDVDSSAIDTAIAKALRLLNVLRQAAVASVQAEASIDAEMRRNFSD